MMLKPEDAIPVTIVIHTLNEEINLPTALASSIPFFDEVLVVDSGSIDKTKAIASNAGASLLELKGDRSTLVKNRNYVLANYPFKTDWVFVLDADEFIPPALRYEIEAIVKSDSAVSGYWVCYENIFLGKWIKRSGIYPNWNLRLLRHKDLRYEDRTVNAHIYTDGYDVGYLKSRFIHDDKRGVKVFLKKLSELAVLESTVTDNLKFLDVIRLTDPRLPHNRRLRTLKAIFQRLPFKPFIIFLYLYFFKLGFLEGRPGYYHCIYRSMIEVSMEMARYEHRLSETHTTNS